MTPIRARELLAAFRGTRVLLIGDLMLDEWVFGTVKRISPEAPIPIVNIPLTPDARAEKPGGAGNVAAILLTLGATVSVVGVTGDDAYGARLSAELATRGADVSPIILDSSRPTTHKLRIIAGRQQLLRIDTEYAAPLSAEISRRLLEETLGHMSSTDVILVSDYAKGVVTPDSLPREVAASAHAAGIPFCADPKPANIALYAGASLVSPNESEALQAAALLTNGASAISAQEGGDMPAEVSAAGVVLRNTLCAEAVFITRHEHGIAVFEQDSITTVPSIAGSGDVGDGTGCGDAVIAVSALALAAGASAVEAAGIANAAGSVVSRFVGVHNPTAGEIAGALMASGQ